MKKTTLGFFFCLLTIVVLSAQSSYDSNEGRVFTNLNDALLQPDRVFHLDLSEQQLKTLPEELYRLDHLRSLDLSYNKLAALDDFDFSHFKNLQALNLFDNQLTTIPSSIFSVYHIQSLNLGNNQIAEIPVEIQQLKHLEDLKLHHNAVKSLPVGWQLPYLKKLRLDGNQIVEISSQFFAQLPRLQQCNLNQNKLSNLPASITKCELIALDIGANSIENLKVVPKITSLERLILDWNVISDEVLEALVGLINLEVLSLEHCQLSYLTSTVGAWQQLRELSLIDNDLKSLPVELSQLKKLEKIWLSKNDLPFGHLQKLELDPRVEVIMQ